MENEIQRISRRSKVIFKAKSLCSRLILGAIVFSAFFGCSVFAEMPKELIPVGKTVGITILSEGAVVVNTAEFKSKSGDDVSPAWDSGIRPGDRIVEINGNKIVSARDVNRISEENGEKEMEVTIFRGENTEKIKVTPKYDPSEDKIKLGVWIKDSSSGIGTLTYINPENGNFGALGHGICESGGSLCVVCDGKILNAEVSSVRKGEKGSPGELMGIFSEDGEVLGDVDKNTEKGIFGITEDNKFLKFKDNKIPVAKREEVTEGEIKILSNIEGQEVKEYSAEISKINDDTEASKGMIIKITDPVLIEKTGGIVQGMSGSPIIQNGKLVGAVTHVFINNPAKGYGIFIENMLAEAEKNKG